MLTYKDCLDMAAVSEDEIDAIARHERIPALIALELGNRLLETPEGTARLRDFIADEVRRAQARSDCAACARFGQVLGRYLEAHPDCRAGDAGQAERLAGMVAIGLVARLRACGAPLSGEAEDPVAAFEAAVRRAAPGSAETRCPACTDACLRLLRALDR